VERQVKERLIGAAVLVAIAVILIPELLSGPAEKKSKPVTSSTPSERVDEPGLKTYRFDLSKPGATNGQLASSTDEQSERRAATTVDEQSLPQQYRGEMEADVETTAVPPRELVADSTPPPASAPAAMPRARNAAEPVVSKPKAATPASSSPGWAVQLGSFADAERAKRLVERMRVSGHNAYLVPLRRNDGTTLHRVRIGPYAERSAAERALQRVSGEVKGAAIVSQP
jgi:DedD protein